MHHHRQVHAYIAYANLSANQAPLKNHGHKFHVCKLSIASKLSPKLDIDAISRRVLPRGNA